MNNQQTYESIPTEHEPITILDDDVRNAMVIFIAEYIGAIPKNYSSEQQRLAVYTSYPPMDVKQRGVLAIDNITSHEVKRQISEKVYQELASIFGSRMINWTSIIRTTAKRFIENAVDDAVDSMRDKLLETIENENSKSYNCSTFCASA